MWRNGAAAAKSLNDVITDKSASDAAAESPLRYFRIELKGTIVAGQID